MQIPLFYLMHMMSMSLWLHDSAIFLWQTHLSDPEYVIENKLDPIDSPINYYLFAPRTIFEILHVIYFLLRYQLSHCFKISKMTCKDRLNSTRNTQMCRKMRQGSCMRNIILGVFTQK